MTTSAREPSPGGDLLPEDILISSVTRVLQLRTKWQLWDPVIDDSRIMWAILPASVAWLVSAQRPDGSWGSQRFSGSVAVTAHGLLALASTGSTGLAGPHAAASERAIGFLIGRAGSDGLIAGNEASANGPMYGHAFAVQALAELSG